MSSREVKFRAYYRREEEKTVHDKPYAEWSPSNPHCNLAYVLRDSDYWTVQYTGITDCKGVEIYEGDIIEHGNGDRFSVEDITPIRKETYYDYEHYDDFLSMSDVDYEVIGNIYENSELLDPLQSK